MTTANPDDLFVVNRNDTTYSVRQDELMALIQPTDHMVINRNDITYKITGEEVIDSFIPEIIFTAVIINNTSPTTRDTISATLDVSGGQPPYTLTYVWKYRNQTTGVPETILDGAITASLYIPDEFAGFEFACEVTFEDNRGSSATKQSDYTNPAVLFAAPPVLDSVDLTLTSGGTNRFTSETFSAQTTLSYEGQPESNKIVVAYADGSFIQSTVTAPIESIQITPSNYTSRLSTNDPLGIQNAANLFDGNFNTYGSVRGGYYIQFEFPYPIPWFVNGDPYTTGNYRGSIGTNMAPGAYGTLSADYSDDNQGAGNFSFLTNWAYGGYGGAVADVRFTQTRVPATEIKAIRYYDFTSQSTVHLLSMFQSDENYLYNTTPNSGGVYLADDSFYKITLQSDLNLQYLEEGDEITLTGGSQVGQVYKIDRANRQITLTKPSDTNWTVGSTITIPPKPVLDNRLYLVLDNSGNVIDLDKNKPLPTYNSTEPNPVFTLQFPATFPGGLTPDQELVENTRLTVEVTASNVVGVSGPRGDSITPGVDTYLNKTAAEKEVTAALAATAEHRATLQQAVIAEQAEATLRQTLLAQGFSQTAIDAALGS
tara:strand:+ start:126 stop:1919 length:1794 start_codon:yes stop_codon:yes gene_type:complete